MATHPHPLSGDRPEAGAGVDGSQPPLNRKAKTLMNTPALPAVWTAESAAAFARHLPADARRLLTEALEQANAVEWYGQLLAHLRECLGDDLPHVAGLLFEPGPASRPAGLNYFSDVFHVYYTDHRAPIALEAPSLADDLLFSIYQTVSSNAALVIIPATGDETVIEDVDAVWKAERWIVAHNTREVRTRFL